MLALTLATSASLALVHQPAFAFMPRQVRSRSPMVRTRGEVTLAEGVQNAIPDVPTTPATDASTLAEHESRGAWKERSPGYKV